MNLVDRDPVTAGRVVPLTSRSAVKRTVESYPAQMPAKQPRQRAFSVVTGRVRRTS
jgi:hypothetical protein